ncbi:hypothetical protein GYMLUDRAFT_43096 [Collybiopsis luxurians FD-317 M1]|uniref:Small heat shock protein n=1 Tax=Collybiopsis luxurians FD-317 M1 TaxID=944289 RepID=A0A0D0CEP2_9AGAR|nr:hypothetical protein GYMLUDRAFT_43096 [Collybiopsis luxurians FD-317 M1]
MSVYFYEPFHNFDRFFDASSLRSANGSTAVSPLKPKMDLHEDTAKNTVTATFELPGLKKEDLDINVHDGRLTVSGQSKISSEHKEEGYALRERSYGRFSRALRLPRGVKEENIKASLEDGLLIITFPKSTPETEPTKITIA